MSKCCSPSFPARLPVVRFKERLVTSRAAHLLLVQVDRAVTIRAEDDAVAVGRPEGIGLARLKLVSPHYARHRVLSAFDFFCIVIWKANRAKSRVAERLLSHGNGYADLEDAVDSLVTAISEATDRSARLSVLIEGWGFRLPMASAILTVLYLEEFSVYDVRVCDVLGGFSDAQYKTNFAMLWERYSAYLRAVRNAVPQCESLRDKDRYLWGKSFSTQLEADIALCFGCRDRDAAFQTRGRQIRKYPE
jgi:hypothetical protein